MQLEIAHPLHDARIPALHDAAFQRSGCESRLVLELAGHHPDFDPGLSLLATADGHALGHALFLPRTIRLRGSWVRLCIAAPLGVHPGWQRRGVGRLLLRTGLAALRDRGIRGAIVIGASEFYGAFGFESAFNAHTARVAAHALPEEGDTSSWRALAGRDLRALIDLQQRCYAEVDGSERRHASAIEWESAAPLTYTLVSERNGEVDAYVRFRVRAEVELTECAVADRGGVEAVLRFLRRLLREHRRTRIDAHLPPVHPLAREFFRRGAVNEVNNLGGAARLAVVDWPGLLADTASSWSAALDRAGRARASIALGGADRLLVRTANGLEVGTGRVERDHVTVPAGWSAGLLTGQLDHRDLAAESAGSVHAVARELFPGATPQWTYGPVFELADD